jgi:beta-lactamase class A
MQARHYKGVLSWCIRDESGHIVAAENVDVVLPHASVGKVLLLIEAARRICEQDWDPAATLGRPDTVQDSGLWQHMELPALTIHDACVLIGAVSDNLATNALIDAVGLDAVAHMCRTSLPHLPTLELCDVVRENREAAHPAELSLGSVRDWSQLMHELASGTVISPDVSRLVSSWLALSVDHSMVLAPFAFDPLVSDGTKCLNKTGSDTHVRADVGVLHTPRGSFAFSACVSPITDAVHACNELRAIGVRIQRM